jgi:hypothetical protein
MPEFVGAAVILVDVIQPVVWPLTSGAGPVGPTTIVVKSDPRAHLEWCRASITAVPKLCP